MKPFEIVGDESVIERAKKYRIPLKFPANPFPCVPAVKIPEEWRVEDGRKKTDPNTP